MGYYRHDPYHQPEEFGLTPVALLEDNEPYEFDILQVWKHDTGMFYWARSSGCSCPAPFEDFVSLDDLEVLDNYWAFEDEVLDMYSWAISSEYSHFSQEQVDEFLRKVKKLVNT